MPPIAEILAGMVWRSAGCLHGFQLAGSNTRRVQHRFGNLDAHPAAHAAVQIEIGIEEEGWSDYDV